MTSFNMHLSGQRDAGSTNAPGATNDGGVNLFVTFRVNGAVLADVPGLTVISGAQLLSGANASQPMLTEVGVLDGWRPPEGDITSPAFMVQTGTPFTLQIQMDVTAGAGADGFNETLEAFGNGDFGNTLRFVTNGPVFNLSDGYTASSPDAGITDNRVPCTSDCTRAESTCDAGKTKCVAKTQACLLKVHATAEKKGEPPDPAALQKCTDAFDGGTKGFAKGCIGKLESKQKTEKPKTLCSATGDLAALEQQVDAFVTDVVTAIDPGFPTVGEPSGCDAGKKKCVATRVACLLAEHGRAGLKNVTSDPARLQKCTDVFDGGSKGFAKGSIGKLEGKQDPAKPKTLCAVTGDIAVLAAKADAFVAEAVGAIRNAP
jgi:hypothetical protein